MSRTFIPETGFLRLSQIIGNPAAGIPAIIPVSRSSWYAGIQAARFPRPIQLTERSVAWRVADIRALIEKLESDNANA